MKKIFLTVLAFLYFFSFSFCQKPEQVTDVQLLELKGKVKSMKESVYTAVLKDGKVEKNKLHHQETYSYTETGQLTEGSWPDKDGLEMNVECYYDEQHALKERGIKGKENYVKVKYEYDAKGNLILESEFAKDGSLNHKTVHVYDEAGQLREESEYRDSSVFMEKIAYAYDKSGHLVEKIVFNSANKVEGKTTFIYNDKGQKTDEILYDHEGQINRYEYSYKEKGKLAVLLQYSKPGKLETRTVYTYNENGYVTEEAHYNANGTLEHKHVFRYTIDDQGNWKSMIVMENDKAKMVVERQIQYY